MSLKEKIRPDNTYRKEEDLGFDVEGISVRRLPPVSSMNYISLTEDFYKRSKDDQLMFLWSLCSSLNYAIDVMQQERNQVLEDILPKKEALVVALQNQNDELAQTMQSQVVAANALAQQRAGELYEVKATHREEIRALKAEVKKLQG